MGWLVVACIAQNLSTSQGIMFFDPKPVNPWHSRKKLYRESFTDSCDQSLDLVAPDPDDHRRLLVAEVKWRRLTVAERKNVLRQLESKWSRCSLRARHPNVRFDVLDASILARLTD